MQDQNDELKALVECQIDETVQVLRTTTSESSRRVQEAYSCLRDSISHHKALVNANLDLNEKSDRRQLDELQTKLNDLLRDYERSHKRSTTIPQNEITKINALFEQYIQSMPRLVDFSSSSLENLLSVRLNSVQESFLESTKTIERLNKTYSSLFNESNDGWGVRIQQPSDLSTSALTEKLYSKEHERWMAFLECSEQTNVIPFGIKDEDPFVSQKSILAFPLNRLLLECEFTSYISESSAIAFVWKNRCVQRFYENHGTVIQKGDSVEIIDIDRSLVMLLRHKDTELILNTLLEREDRGLLKFHSVFTMTHKINQKKQYFYTDILALRCCEKHHGRVVIISPISCSTQNVNVYDVDRALHLSVDIDDLYVFVDSAIAMEPPLTALCCLFEAFIAIWPHFECSDDLVGFLKGFIEHENAKISTKAIKRSLIRESCHVIDLYDQSSKSTVKQTFMICTGIQIFREKFGLFSGYSPTMLIS
ncbi:hypothetical protein ACOME3_006011 [Neoechinorhynchus agilis]